ncbi:hypothetical protein [Nocardia iowensis]|uniref:Uncharacterized protein n=1 Tax=Nocardia iowensis TaxID=204891 RepID=A0ABX8RY76_NOCIO|nr:hypothetical protein [Nocardia iowensis]QXN94146.1 hypothetical protein KV110_14430 [Nocardia iowensis]
MLKSRTQLLGATLCGAALVGAALAGAGTAAADPGPGEQVIIINGEQRHDIDRVILREDLSRDLPGYTLPAGSPGVLVLKNGEVQPVPEGAVLKKNR